MLHTRIQSESEVGQTAASDAEKANLARLDELIVAQEAAHRKKEEAKREAAEEAARAAKKKGDADKLAKLEKLVLAQKNEQLKREAAREAEDEARKADEELRLARVALEAAAEERRETRASIARLEKHIFAQSDRQRVEVPSGQLGAVLQNKKKARKRSRRTQSAEIRAHNDVSKSSSQTPRTPRDRDEHLTEPMPGTTVRQQGKKTTTQRSKNQGLKG